MSVLGQLSSFKNEKGNSANIALAKQLAHSHDALAIRQLASGLQHDDKKIRHDCLKVLYELGYLDPKAIVSYTEVFAAVLVAKDNRMIWGAMIALSTIATIQPARVFKCLDRIKYAITNGSTITIDNGVRILALLIKDQNYRPQAEQFLLDILWNCPIKQLPMYAQLCKQSIDAHNCELFKKLMVTRLPECEKESQAKRLEKLLKAIQK